MSNYPKYQEFKFDTLCSVDNCKNSAEYEVVLYDFYPHLNQTFYEQDLTCPFLCQFHLNENETRAIGERIPRGTVSYPYTNKHNAQGYSKYNPLKEIYPEFFNSSDLENNEQLQLDIKKIDDELIAYLAKYPEFLRQLNPRKFEELIAELFKSKGYEVQLTPKTKDGGKDIIATYKSAFGHQIFIIECKRYSEKNKVGVELVRGLYGVKQAENYNQAILVTTSTFSKPAIDFVMPLKFQLALKDYQDVTEWCRSYRK